MRVSGRFVSDLNQTQDPSVSPSDSPPHPTRVSLRLHSLTFVSYGLPLLLFLLFFLLLSRFPKDNS